MSFLKKLLALATFSALNLGVLQPLEASFSNRHLEVISSDLSLEALSLEKAQDYLMQHHPKLLSILASEESSHQVYLQAWSAWLPSVSASASYLDNQAPGKYSSGIGVSQTLFDNSSYWNVRLRKIDWAMAKAQVASLKNDLLYELRATYYGLIVTMQEVKAAEENVELLQASYQREKERFEIGDVTSFQMNQSKVALSNSLTDLYAARSNLKKAYQSLFVALGLFPSQEPTRLSLSEAEIPVHHISLVKDLLESLEAHQLEAGLSEKSIWQANHTLFSLQTRQRYIDRALEKSPQVVIGVAKVDRSKLSAKSKLGEYLPSVSASLAYSNALDRSTNNPFEGRYDSTVGVSLQWTLLDGFARERRLSQAKWNKISDEEGYRQLTHQTKQNVLSSFYELEEACQTYVASSLGVKLAQEAMEQASHQRTWGVISPLEYREAAALLTKSKRDFAKSSYQLIMAYYKLVYNTGEDVAGDYVEIDEAIDHAKMQMMKR